MSSASSVNDALTDYLAGRLTAEQLVASVTAEYYRETRNGKRETWRSIMDVIEKAHPGIVQLSGSNEKPGFAVRLAERPFPKRYEAELRSAVQAIATTPTPSSKLPTPGFITRIVRAIKSIFSA